MFPLFIYSIINEIKNNNKEIIIYIYKFKLIFVGFWERRESDSKSNIV